MSVTKSKRGLHGTILHLAVGVFLLLLVLVCAGSPLRAQAPRTYPVTVGFSGSMFPETNRSDAKAAIKVWGDVLSARKNVAMNLLAEIYDDLPKLRKAAKDGLVDLVTLRVDEFLKIEADRTLIPTYVGIHDGGPLEQYVVLVRKEQASRGLAGLRGGKFLSFVGARSGMAMPWLDSELLSQVLPPAAQFFLDLSEAQKITKVVLPVFFGQADGCLVTSSGYKTMVQLNPQVGEKLVPICSSPAVLPNVFCFRAGFASEIKSALAQAILELHQDAKGEQVLMLFGVNRLVPFADTYLEGARQIMDKYQKLSAKTGR